MSWSIAEVAKLSGVTSRTLRHYDAIGLLAPAWTEPSGRRYYEQNELLRLQRILLLRDLGLGLDAIAEILAAQDRHSTVEVLRRHRAWLIEERKRLGRLVSTVEATMANLERGGEMAAEKMFEGFEHNPYEAEARERWGDATIDESYARMQGWTPEQHQQAQDGMYATAPALREFMEAGVAVDDERVQQIVDGHHTWLNLFWTPNRESYKGLADLYYDDDRFRANIGGGDDALVAYLRDAMKAYADARLS